MVETTSRSSGERLERSCTAGPGDWYRSSQPVGGVELLEAWFGGHAYAKHRHDTYAIGVTESGVQTFDYRGVTETSTPGHVVVLHPDEMHDGRAGTESGFGYRMVYVEPARILEAIRAITGRPRSLPFVDDVVSANRTLSAAVRTAFEEELQPLAIDSLIVRLAEGLIRGAGQGDSTAPARRLDLAALDRARRFLEAENTRIVHSSELEATTGLSRYELARQFRAGFGTSPYRYSLMRRLDLARDRLRGTQPLADVALETGFADQAHLTRMFKSAFGITPGRYRTLYATGAQPANRPVTPS
jgi:AraC-like DNA-binding protein